MNISYTCFTRIHLHIIIALSSVGIEFFFALRELYLLLHNIENSIAKKTEGKINYVTIFAECLKQMFQFTKFCCVFFFLTIKIH